MDEHTPTGPARAHRRGRTMIICTAVAVTLGLAGAGAVLAGTPGGDADAATGPKPTTAVVERKSVDRTVTSRGTLGYDSRGPVTAQRGGTVTAPPVPGTVLTPGATLLRIDDRPVTVFRGALPSWRPFAAGMAKGPDVRQLEQALRDAGFDPGFVDEEFTAVTGAAVERWQKSLGAPQSGTIALGDVLFMPEDLRVGSTTLTAGATIAAGDEVATLATGTRAVAATITPEQRSSVHAGGTATVTLPDGKAVPAKIRSVGQPEQPEEDETGSPRVPITLALDDDAAAGDASDVDVRVDIATPGIRDALVVPVEAVLATGHDTYGVQVLTGTTVRTKTVELGESAAGSVAVTKGLRAGERVVVPR
ncbi:efflux RND transporter periplasmic adaptor subunit [Curtobacterium sp. PhB136]|uniref:efflux RND transporter periplasmic adaptor subunit n=1 Tax=Curtobacterium sp. PhB136 TaxID=2485181 RepID=UPI001047C772|nr:efflux RND transporter periplasmic adaptor subunit [Curtobacterium sp. PhB136]TCK65638.1 multidrug efflux pump subunit AcrA (membrane-fusion protein) [Curtobacterium sp. PhB136]